MSGIQSLRDRLAELDSQEKALRIESCGVVSFIPRDDDGSPQQIVTDARRFAEIGQGLKDIASERASILDKLDRLKALPGDGLHMPAWRSQAVCGPSSK
jgi:hypothetical protein